MASNDRLERLINLVAALVAADRPLTREELRDRVQPPYPEDRSAFHRAFERDKEALRAMSIPIAVAPVDRTMADSVDAYRIPREQYELPDPGLEPDELAALHLAVSAVRVEGSDATAAIWKLGGAVGEPGEGHDEVALAGSEHLSALFAAVSGRRVVSFRYRDQQRTLQPGRLSFQNGRWYVQGHDPSRAEERMFRLHRMTAVAAVGPTEAFARPTMARTGPLRPWEFGDGSPVLAQVLIDHPQAERAVRLVGESAVVERRDDGSMVFELAVTSVSAFRDFVLSFLDRAEVLGPPELRAAVVDWLRALV